MSQSPAPAHVHSSGHGVSPILVILVGAACFVFWVLASLLQIQTSEAYMLHGAVVMITPNWAILNQPFDFFTGHLPQDVAKAVLWGWGVELIYLVCIVGYEIAHESVRAANKGFAKLFGTGMLVLIVIDAVTDFSYGTLGSGFWGQVAFAGITSFIVMFFGIIGIRLIEHGFNSWKA